MDPAEATRPPKLQARTGLALRGGEGLLPGRVSHPCSTKQEGRSLSFTWFEVGLKEGLGIEACRGSLDTPIAEPF